MRKRTSQNLVMDDVKITITTEDHERNFTFLLAGKIWTVTFCDSITLPDGGMAGGITYARTNAIYIEDGESLDNTITTFFHELTHAICSGISYYYPDSNEEYVADHMGYFLPHVIAQLPLWITEGYIKSFEAVVKYVTKKNKKPTTKKSVVEDTPTKEI